MFFKLQKFLEILSWYFCYFKLIFYTREVLLDLTSIRFSSQLYIHTHQLLPGGEEDWTMGLCWQ